MKDKWFCDLLTVQQSILFNTSTMTYKMKNKNCPQILGVNTKQVMNFQVIEQGTAMIFIFRDTNSGAQRKAFTTRVLKLGMTFQLQSEVSLLYNNLIMKHV